MILRLLFEKQCVSCPSECIDKLFARPGFILAGTITVIARLRRSENHGLLTFHWRDPAKGVRSRHVSISENGQLYVSRNPGVLKARLHQKRLSVQACTIAEQLSGSVRVKLNGTAPSC